MLYSSLADIDYGQIWEKQIRPFSSSGDREEFWDRRAQSFENKGRTSTYTDDVINRMELDPSFSLLDIGCGPGVVALPLAAKVARVTALDISQVMLDKLQQKISRSRIQNITLLKKNFHEAIIMRDVQEHDVVLSSRSISGARLADCLTKMNLLAKRACYITWRAERYVQTEVDICTLLNQEYRPYAEYSVIYNLLYQMGILANVEVFESRQEEQYPDLESAVTSLNKGVSVPDGTIKERFYDYAKRILVFQNDRWYRFSSCKWALISWKK